MIAQTSTTNLVILVHTYVAMVVAQLEGEANNSAGRSRLPFSAHVAIRIPQYTGTKPAATVRRVASL